MYQGTRTLSKAISAYLACISFPIAYLVSLGVGASWTTATLRGVIATLIVFFIGRVVLYPLIDTLLAAITEAERKRKEAEE